MKLNLRTKLIGSFIIILLLIVVVGLMGTYTSKTIRDRLDNIIEQDVKPANILGDVARRAGFIRSNSLLHLLTRSIDDMNRYESEVADWTGKVNTNLNTLENIFKDQATLDKLAEFRTAWETYLRIWREQVVPLSRTNRDEEAFTLARKSGAGGMAAREAMYKLDELHDVNVAAANHRLKLANQDSRKSQYILSAVILLAFILGLAFGIRQGSLIAGSVNAVSKAAQLVAAGDLDQRVMVKTGDEIESMADSFNTMTVKLKTMVEELQREITERRRAEDRLRESEQWLSTTLRSIGDAVIATDAEGLVTLMNSVAEDLTGWDEPETAGKPLEDIFNTINDQTGGRAENPVAKVLREGVVVGLADYTVLIAKDGTKRPIADSRAPIRDEEGEIIGTVMVFRDITELKQAEEELRKHRDHLEELVKDRTEALRESEEKYKMMFEGAKDAVFLSDKTGKFVDVNQVACESLGYSEEELLKLSNKEIDADPRGFEAFRKIRNGSEERTTFEVNQRRKNGTLLPVEITGSFFTSGGQQIALAIARDITERKRAEEKIKQVKEYLELQVARMPIGLIIWDTEFRVTSWNPAAERIFGFTAEETLGKHPYDLIVPKEAQPHMDDIWRRLLEGDMAAYSTNENITKDNRTIICEWTNTPLKKADGTVMGVLSMAKDITEQKNLEAQFRQAQKMEAIGTLTGGIAHDFNNLLTAILGNAQLALMNVIKDESLRMGIEEIKKAGERAASLTRQLLAFSRKQVIQPRILDVNEVINETEKMLKRMIREDIEFLTVLEPELWKIHADPGQIDQVLMNLVVNARDAMPSGGKLTIETVNVELDGAYFQDRGVENEPGPYVMLAVTDNGTGMDKETLSRIFDPFFTTKEVGSGTGLGLSTVYGIVKQNKGYVWVYSEPGKGTTFKIYFPRVAKDVVIAGKEQEEFAGEISGSETVLIVEDDDALRNITKKMLQKYGYKILEAENGEKALNIGETHEGPIHLLLMDVVMPGMSGSDLSEKMQSIRPETRVLYMSGYTDNAIVRYGILRRDINFIEKPFSPESLGKKVRQALDGGN